MVRTRSRGFRQRVKKHTLGVRRGRRRKRVWYKAKEISLAPSATTDDSGRSFAKLSLLHWAIQKRMQIAGPLALRFPPATTTQAVGLG